MNTFSGKLITAMVLAVLPCAFTFIEPYGVAVPITAICWYIVYRIVRGLIREVEKEEQRTAGQAVRCHKGCANERTRSYYNIKK
jgi:uncharacterized membrane protein